MPGWNILLAAGIIAGTPLYFLACVKFAEWHNRRKS